MLHKKAFSRASIAANLWQLIMRRFSYVFSRGRLGNTLIVSYCITRLIGAREVVPVRILAVIFFGIGEITQAFGSADKLLLAFKFPYTGFKLLAPGLALMKAVSS